MLGYRHSAPAALFALAAVVAISAANIAAQTVIPVTPLPPPPFQLVAESCPRVADAKLTGGAVAIRYMLVPPRAKSTTTITLLQGGATVATLWSGQDLATTVPVEHLWNGRTTTGAWMAPGSYTIRVLATPNAGGAAQSIDYPIDLVRLGISEWQAQGPTKYQLVYYKKATLYRFFVTPAMHEYSAIADVGDVADLDRNDGSPRPAPAVHTGIASPALEPGNTYEDDNYNYPVCYTAGSKPKLTVRFGVNCTDGLGAAQLTGVPLAGMPIRCRAITAGAPWLAVNDTVVPGGTATFSGPALPNSVGRTDVPIAWTFEYTPDNGQSWVPIAGRVDTTLRCYTILGAPQWAAGGTGLQYAGPWVEVLEDLHLWKTALGIDTRTAPGVMEALIKGFSGQIGPLPTAIEGVVYDTNTLGGDGGASHYYLGFPPTNSVQLSRLLDAHANGVFVNCSDCASATAAMLGMLGVTGVQLQRLGNMNLRAIRGIGAPAYTLSLWGTGSSHAFSYHHIITRNGGSIVSDACLWVDEDGNPSALPGLPGYNVERPWNSTPNGYMQLSAIGAVSFFLDPLPKVQ